MKWISVKDRLPEEDQELIIKGEIGWSPNTTTKLLVLTNKGTVSDNKRLQFMVGDKKWIWLMGYEGEYPTHWCVFEEPVKE